MKEIKQKNTDYFLNFFRMKKVKEKILLITEQGGWVYLSKEKYTKLLRYELDEKTIAEFEEIGLLISARNIEFITKTEFSRRKFMFYPPALHIILPTKRCNHCCVYCHSSAITDKNEKNDLSKENAEKIVDFILSCPSKNLKIEFQGGDPLLNFDCLKHIVNYTNKQLQTIKKKEVITSVVSNLTPLTEEQLLWLSKNKIHISTSLDGPKIVHDKNRTYIDHNSSYDEVIKKIDFCKKHNIKVGALMTTTKHSLKYPEEIVDEYIKQGFKSIQLKFLNKIGFAQNSWKEIGYSAEEYLEFWKSAMDHIIKKNIEGTVIIERFSQLLLKKILTFNEPGFLDFRNPCGIALGQIAYNVNGDIYCCDEGRGFDIFNMGNVNTTSFKEYAKSPKTHKLVESSMLEITYCDTCIFKPFCGNCPVLNYAEQNNLISKIALNQRCKIMKGKFEWLFDKLMFDENARMVFNKWMKND